MFGLDEDTHLSQMKIGMSLHTTESIERQCAARISCFIAAPIEDILSDMQELNKHDEESSIFTFKSGDKSTLPNNINDNEKNKSGKGLTIEENGELNFSQHLQQMVDYHKSIELDKVTVM